MSEQRFSSKQINRIFSFPIQIENFTTTAANSDSVTAQLASALANAGDGGVALPNQASANVNQEGYINVGDFAVCKIFDYPSGEEILVGANEDELYGRLNGTTLEYYFKDNTGTETAYTFTAPSTITFEFNYRAQFNRIPADFAIASQSRDVSNYPGGSTTTTVTEPLTVTAVNTFSGITSACSDVSRFRLSVNGAIYHNGTGTAVQLPSGTVGTSPTWNSGAFTAQEAFDIEPGDCVFAIYPTKE